MEPTKEDNLDREFDPVLVDWVVCELFRFSRDDDEEEVARRIIKEVLRRQGKTPYS